MCWDIDVQTHYGILVKSEIYCIILNQIHCTKNPDFTYNATNLNYT